MDLKDKVVIIIGGSQGFGRALAERFISEGSIVYIASMNKTSVEKTAGEIGVKSFVVDVRDETSLRKAAESIVSETGRIDIWVNSAGLFMKFPKYEFFQFHLL